MCMSAEKYKQCNLRKGTSCMVSWIPVRAAKVGNIVDVFDAGKRAKWFVEAVGNVAMSKEAVDKQERVFKQFQGSTKGGGIDV